MNLTGNRRLARIGLSRKARHRKEPVMRRVAPAFALFFLAPLVAEYLLGDFPPASSRRVSRCSRAAVREDPGKSRCPRPARRACSDSCSPEQVDSKGAHAIAEDAS